jgi:outer membrane protein assembly factor BamB
MKCYNPYLFILFFIAFLLSAYSASSQDKNWTHFRGNRLDGIALTDNVPLKWDAQHIRWKTKIHDKGLSSPVIYNNQVWVTTARQDGKELYAVCTDFENGKILFDILVFTPDEVYGKHTINTYATPTPCIEKGFVYVHYGSMGTACINTANGSIVWKRSDLKCNHIQGPGASPVIYKNLIILHFEGTDSRYIVALNKLNGKLVWRSDRPSEPYEPVKESSRKSYSTPIIINVKGRDMLISAGSAVCSAYDPNTGKEIWRVVDGAEAAIAQPFTENGVIFWYTGYMFTAEGSKFTEILAVNPEGKGDITETNILWKKKAEPLQLLTPVIKDGLIYTVDTKNRLMCIDAATGEEVWSDRLKSNFNASPVYLNGNIWFFSVKGEILVIKAGRKYEIVATNQMDPEIWATPAFLRNSAILRIDDFLYRIGDK